MAQGGRLFDGILAQTPSDRCVLPGTERTDAAFLEQKIVAALPTDEP